MAKARSNAAAGRDARDSCNALQETSSPALLISCEVEKARRLPPDELEAVFQLMCIVEHVERRGGLLLRKALDDVGADGFILPALKNEHRHTESPRCGVELLRVLIKAEVQALGTVEGIVEDFDVAGLSPPFDAAGAYLRPAIPLELDGWREQDEMRDRMLRPAGLPRGGLDGDESSKARAHEHDVPGR